MPELPDLLVYKHALERRLKGQRIRSIRILSPFLLRTVEPTIGSFEERSVLEIRLVGKRVIWTFEDDLHLVFHLMVAGRFHWKAAGRALNRKTGLASFDLDAGSLHMTEASTKKRASLHAVSGWEAVGRLDKGGLDVLRAAPSDFSLRLRAERHTLKRSLTDPRLFSGIGNAYSDEILHRAGLSPLQLTSNLSDNETSRLYTSTRAVLSEWTDRLLREAGDEFPEKVTAFRPEMAVHGKFGKPCPVCSAPVQRIVYAENECNYCPGCQTEGRILADRSLSRLLRDDWPRSIDELGESG